MLTYMVNALSPEWSKFGFLSTTTPSLQLSIVALVLPQNLILSLACKEMASISQGSLKSPSQPTITCFANPPGFSKERKHPQTCTCHFQEVLQVFKSSIVLREQTSYILAANRHTSSAAICLVRAYIFLCYLVFQETDFVLQFKTSSLISFSFVGFKWQRISI